MDLTRDFAPRGLFKAPGFAYCGSAGRMLPTRAPEGLIDASPYPRPIFRHYDMP